MDGATRAHLKMLYRVIKYIFDTEHWKLKMNPQFNMNNMIWTIEAYCDSDYSGDKDTRISVSGFIIFVLGCAVSWKSKAQKSITLSSTEAEYVAISELCTELLFIKQVLEFLGAKIDFPMIVRVDNVGAIYLAKNQTTGQQTKHIDICYHFVREFIEDGIIKIIFVKSEENMADIFTKTVKESLNSALTEDYMHKEEN